MPDTFELAGYNAGKIGFGRKPAVIVVDFQVAFTDPQFPLGGFKRIHDAVDQTARLLEVARRNSVPVASCYTGYNSPKDMPFWKITAVQEQFFEDHACMAMDERIHDKSYDYVFKKSAPSIFFNTPLTTFLTKQGVDTVIVAGCTTSGCVRASVIDCFSHGFRTIVAEDCSGDPEEQPHLDNLRDMGRRYADISNLAECAAYLEENRKRNA